VLFRAFRGKEVIHQLPGFTLRSYAALREIFTLLLFSQSFQVLQAILLIKSFVYPSVYRNIQTVHYLTQRSQRDIGLFWSIGRSTQSEHKFLEFATFQKVTFLSTKNRAAIKMDSVLKYRCTQ
jgi:hypothetical protein